MSLKNLSFSRYGFLYCRILNVMFREKFNDAQKESAESDLCDRPKSDRPSSAHSSFCVSLICFTHLVTVL